MTDADERDIKNDMEAINKISIVPTMLEVICRTTKMGFAAIARVTDEKWIACAVKDDISFGLKPGGELVLETTICNEIRQHKNAVVIDDVSKDEIFSCHHTPAMYGFQSYISIPITRKNGDFFGTLCAIDPNPAKLNNVETIGMFKLFADLISLHLSAVEDLAIAETKLSEEKNLSELREQFIAVLGHDLRNPVSAITMGAGMLETLPLSKEGKSITGIIKNSTSRITSLINNLMDFAKGRLGGGIQMDNKLSLSLEATLHQVTNELKLQYPDRVIQEDIQISREIICDEVRIAQLFSNLLANAIVHSMPNTLIEVTASVVNDKLCLTVTNESANIPQPVLDNIFHPFYRANDRTGKNGLGLGLYIASEIAKAHRGELTATWDKGKVLFILTMPV